MGKARNLSKLSSALDAEGAVPAIKGGTGTTTGGSGVTVYATVAALPLTGVNGGAQAYVTATNRLYLWTGTGWYNIAIVNQAPTITSGANASYTLSINGTPTVVTLQATDPEGLPLTWSYQITSGSLGSTATISQNSNVFTITPSTNSANFGTFEVTFRVTDGVNISTSTSTFTLAFITARYANLGSNTSAGNLGTGVGINSATNFNTSKSLFSGAYPMYFTDAAPPVLSTTLSGTVTLEFWCYLQGTSYWKDFGVINTSGDTSSYKKGMWTIGDTTFGLKDGNSYTSPGTANIIGNWFHIAMCCDGTSCKYYRGGNLIGTTGGLPSGTISITMPTHPGYYQDIQVHAELKYTAAFTPPTRTQA